MIRKKEGMHNLEGLKVARVAPLMTHLFFTDDSLIFTKATHENCDTMPIVLQIYKSTSEQVINFDKSAILFSPNVQRKFKQQLLAKYTVAFAKKYLGLPTMIGRAKNGAMQSIKERVWKRLQGWKERLLSKGRKEVLIKAVAQAIPPYTMSCFLIPMGVCKDLESLMCKFWWRSQEDKRKIHWLSWERLCWPKM